MEAIIEKQRALQKARENDQRVLNEARKKRTDLSKKLGDVKKLSEITSPIKALSLLSQIKPHDIVYIIALLSAILKDILDFIEVTGIGYILVIATTLMTAILIAMMMILGGFLDENKNRANQKITKKWLALGGGTLAEMLFGINFIPIETATVFLIYYFILSERKKTK